MYIPYLRHAGGPDLAQWNFRGAATTQASERRLVGGPWFLGLSKKNGLGLMGFNGVEWDRTNQYDFVLGVLNITFK